MRLAFCLLALNALSFAQADHVDHNHIRQNVKLALRSGEYFIPARSLMGPLFTNVGCHSYSDPE